MSGCASSELLGEFLAGRLPENRSSEIAQHLAVCEICQRAADTLTDDGDVREFHRCHRQLPASAVSGDPPAAWRKPIYLMGEDAPDEPTSTHAHFPASSAHPTVLGRFRVRERLGAGAFGIVYLADDTQLNRQVALKIPRAAALADPDARQRFLREVRAAAALHHPQIVAVYDAGEEQGVYYLASAYCPGDTLLEWLRNHGGPALADEAATILLALAEAVQHAHEHGVLHRDIKPQNVLLDTSAGYRDLPFCPKLTDFSVAKLMEAADDATASNVLIGTPRYMAPEQVAGRRDLLGPACDVYALGVVLYELLTAEPPIRGDDSADTLRRVLQDEPLAPRRRVPHIPLDLEAICLKCLEKEPHKRYASAQLLVDDLQRFLNRQPTLARPIGPAERLARWVRRRPATAALIGAGVAGTLLIVCGLLFYNARLNDFNVSLGKANTDLGRATQAAKQSQALAEQSESQTLDLLYISDMRLANRARLDGDMRTLGELLRRHIPRPGQIDRRGLEWRFLWNLSEVKSQPIAVEQANIYFLCLSGDGKRLASAGKDAVVRVYDREAGGLVQSIVTGQKEVNSVAFSSDGRRLASAGDDGTVRIWNLDDGSQLLSIPAHPGLAFGVLFTADDAMLISCGDDPTVRLWDARSGESRGSLSGHERKVEAIALSPSGRQLASAGADGTMRVWDLVGRDSMFDLKNRYAGGYFFSCVAFSPGGTWLAAGDLDNHVWIWDAHTGRELAVGRHLDHIHSLAISADGRYLASGDEAGVVYLWDSQRISDLIAAVPEKTSEITPVRQWRGHAGRISSMRFEGNDRLLTAGLDGKIESWEVSGIAGPRMLSSRLDKLYSPTFTSDGWLLAERYGVVLWDLRETPDLERYEEIDLDSDYFSPNSHTDLVAHGDKLGGIEFWNRKDRRSVGGLHIGENQDPRDICLSKDGKLLAVLAGNPDREVRLFDVPSGAPRLTLRVPAGSARQLEFSPDGSQLVSCVDSDLLFWQLEHASGGDLSAEPRRLTRAHSTTALGYNREGSLLATGGADRLVKLWNPKTLELVATLSGHRGTINSLAFSPDGRSLVTCTEDGALKFWNVAAREELFDIYQHHDNGLQDLSVSPDGRWLAATTFHYRRLLLFDLGEP